MATGFILVKRALQSIYLNRKIVILLSFIEGFTFCVFSLIASLELRFFVGTKRFEKAIPGDKERVLYIQEENFDLSVESAERWDSFRQEMLEVFPSFGGVGYKTDKLTGGQLLSEFVRWREQSGEMEQWMNDGRVVKVVSVERGLLDWVITENGKGIVDDEAILIGYDYAPFFPIGSKLELNGKEYRVADYLQKGLTIPYSVAIAQDDFGAIELNRCMLIPGTNGVNGIHFACNSSYIILGEKNALEVINLVQSIADRNGVTICIQTIKEYVKEYKRALFFGMQEKIIVGAMILIVCFSSIVVTHLIGTLMRKKEFGILYSCGFSLKMIIIELSAECLLSLGFACVLGYMMNSLVIRFYLRELNTVLNLFGREYWILMGILVGTVAIVSMLIACLQIVFARPSRLMEGQRYD